MISLLNILEWIEEFGIAEHYHIGKLDSKEEKSIGVYQKNADREPRKCLGGYESYDIKGISILIHWNKDADETEQAAMKLYDAISKVTSLTINNIHIPYIKMLMSEPEDVGTDSNGVYERVIWFDLYYRKE